MKIKANATWTVKGSIPYIPVGRNGERPVAKYFITDELPATVPGGVHMDLFNAGVIENPYYETNSLKCEWVENRWWIYETNILIEENKGRKAYLIFEGIDCDCEVYLNDRGDKDHHTSSNNMFVPIKMDVTDKIGETVNVKVVIKGGGKEFGQYGKSSESRTQKSRFGYGWDFSTHLVNMGIWKDVYVEYINDVELVQKNLQTDYVDNVGIMRLNYKFWGQTKDDISLEILDPCGKVILSEKYPFSNNFIKEIRIDNPELWWANGMGEHPLYTVNLKVAGESFSNRLGIRSLRYTINTERFPDAIPYTVILNGKRIYLKGLNKLPFDHLYGNVDDSAYTWYIKALVNSNANTVRCWGGGIIESEHFYDLCDENGIMVWQDFIQSSSGTCNAPSEYDDFLIKLTNTARHAVKERRNHTCLTYWCGGNELAEIVGDDEIPSSYKNKNINLLKEVVDELDPTKLFLPTTPSGPVYRADFKKDYNHDVHGPWEYEFDTHYENYNNFKLLINGEVGTSGPARNTHLYIKDLDMTTPKWNATKQHGNYWFKSELRDVATLGNFENSYEYIPYGQWIQAESLRYIIESERRKAPYTSGTQIWQINEPWPNTDCTCLVEYFGFPKMAYYWVKNAFSDCPASLEYSKISCDGEFKATLSYPHDMEHNDDVEVSIFSTEGKLVKNFTVKGENLPFEIKEKIDEEMFFVRVSSKGVNKDYYFSKYEKTPYKPMRDLKGAELSYNISDIKEGEDGLFYASATVKNASDVAAHFVYPYDETNTYAVLADDAYFTLLPNEEKTISLTIGKRQGLFFDVPDNKFDIKFNCLNK